MKRNIIIVVAILLAIPSVSFANNWGVSVGANSHGGGHIAVGVSGGGHGGRHYAGGGRHYRGGHGGRHYRGGGRHIRGGRHNVRYSTRGYGFGYRGTHRYSRVVVRGGYGGGYGGGYYGGGGGCGHNGGCGCGYASPGYYPHSPAAYRREVYVSERAYRHGYGW